MSLLDTALTRVLRAIYGARVEPVYDVVPGLLGLPYRRLVAFDGTLHNGLSVAAVTDGPVATRRLIVAVVRAGR